MPTLLDQVREIAPDCHDELQTFLESLKKEKKEGFDTKRKEGNEMWKKFVGENKELGTLNAQREKELTTIEGSLNTLKKEITKTSQNKTEPQQSTKSGEVKAKQGLFADIADRLDGLGSEWGGGGITNTLDAIVKNGTQMVSNQTTGLGKMIDEGFNAIEKPFTDFFGMFDSKPGPQT